MFANSCCFFGEIQIKNRVTGSSPNIVLKTSDNKKQLELRRCEHSTVTLSICNR